MANQQTSSKRGEKSKQGGAAQASAAAGKGPSASAKTNGKTVERDETYGLISVLYHALQGAETYSMYIEDARRANDEELRGFFEECRTEENERAKRARQLLATRLEEDEDDEEDDDDEDDEDDDEEDDEDVS